MNADFNPRAGQGEVMATLYNNPRGGLIVDRDSLHASPGYARQVEALKQLRERKVNADVEKAVEAVRAALNDWTATYASEFCDEDTVTAAYKRISNEGTLGYIRDAHGALGKISQALRDQEAEIARLRNIAGCQWFNREAPATVELIDAHLSENEHD